MDAFRGDYSSMNCSDLIDYIVSVPSEHDRFIQSGVWRSTCMNRIEFVETQLHRLADEDAWRQLVGAAFS